MICVLNDRTDRTTLELLSKSNQMAEKINSQLMLILCCTKNPDIDILKKYADKIIVLIFEKMERLSPEPLIEYVEKTVREYSPTIILAPATTFGRTIMPALAAKLKTGLTADCTELDVDENGNLLQTRPAIGGNVMATIITPNHRPQMATVRPKVFPILQVKKQKCEIIFKRITETTDKYQLIGFTEKKEAKIEDSEVVISVGKGLRKKENVQIAEKLARLINGAIGATRAVVDAKWISFDHQVGLSGKVVKPKIYIAAGISGAVQHLAGMQTSQIIIAINKDKYAPIFKVADIGIVSDACSTLEQITKYLEDETNE